MFPTSTRVHSQTFWTRRRFVLCGREKEQTPCIPNWIWRHHEGSIINTWRPNHNVVQSVAAVKWFCRERVAANPLNTIVLGATKHQTDVQWEMSLVLCWICQFQCLKQSIYLQNNHNIYNNSKDSNNKKKNLHDFHVRVSCCQWN